MSAAFPGAARQYARASVIGDKGFVYGGIDLYNNPLNDLWVYDAVLNTWTELAELPAAPRWQAASFVINGQLYYGTGRDWEVFYNDFWKYDPQTDMWEQLNDLPKTPCYETVSFAVYDSGFLGVGRDCTGVYLSDFWRYDSEVDLWMRTSDFPGDSRYYAKAESFAGYGIVGSGQNEMGEMLNDFYAFDPIKESWFKLPDSPMSKRRGMASATIPFRGAFFIGGLDEDFNRSNQVFQLTVKDVTDESFQLIYNSVNKIIYLNEVKASETVRVFNVHGALIHEVEVLDSQFVIRTSAWSNGVYLVHLGNKVAKVVVY